MYKLCKTEQSAQRQRQIEEALLDRMLQQRYEDISVSDLCDKMGIPRKAFYRYFDSKDGCLHAMIDHALLDFDEFALPIYPVQQSARMYMEQFFVYWKFRKPLLDALARSGLSGILVQRAVAYSQNERKLPKFMLRENKQAREYGTLFTVCGMMTMVVQWHVDGFVQSEAQMAQLTVRLVSEPLFPDAKM